MCGFRRIVTTLDDRQLVIQSHLGEVVPHGECPEGQGAEVSGCILNVLAGMPTFGSYFCCDLSFDS